MKRKEAHQKELQSYNFISLQDAVQKIIDCCDSKITNEAIDLTINLNTDPKKTDQNIRTSITLPYSSGKSYRVCVFSGSNEEFRHPMYTKATNDIIDQIKNKKLVRKFDICVADKKSIKLCYPLANILRSKLPNPKQGTVTDNAIKTAKNLIDGTLILIKNDQNIIRMRIGSKSISSNNISDNIISALTQIQNHKPKSLKVSLVKSICISSTQSYGSIHITNKQLNNQ